MNQTIDSNRHKNICANVLTLTAMRRFVPLCRCACLKYLKYLWLLPLLLMLWLLTCINAQEITLPEDNAVAGWNRFEKYRVYVRNDLYGYIDGGAELFLELGFKKLFVQKYHKGSSEIVIEAYQMDSTDSALALYLFKCGKEAPIARISARNTGDQYQFTILKGSHFLLINNFGGEKDLMPAMIEFANAVLKSIPEEKPSVLLKMLPAENLVKGSELIIRGQYSLQSIVTLGEGDILQLGGKIFGVAGDYRDGRGSTYTRIIISYPAPDSAKSAYINLKTHLDSYLKILEESDNNLIFQNSKGLKNTAKLRGAVLEISLNLK